jgi:hypothetical protein
MATQEEIQRQRELNAELEKTAQLRRESVDISSSVIDSLKETLGLQSKRTTFESTLLKNNKDIYQAILNQRTGLSGIDTINKQIIKNEELIAKSKVVQNSLAASLGDKRKKEADDFVEIVKSQQSLEKSIEAELAKVAEGQVINEQNLQNLQNQLSAKTAELEVASENLSILQQQYALNQLNTVELEKQNTEREKEKQIAEEIESTLGVAGQLTKLLGSIPGIGKFAAQSYNEVEKEIQKIYETQGRVVSQSEALGMLTSNVLGKAFKALTDPFTILIFAAKQLKDALFSINEDTVKLQKNLALSSEEARELRAEFADAATASDNNLINTRDLVKAQGELNDLLGLQGKINEQNLITQTELTKLLGIEGKEAAQLQYFAEATGKDFGQQKLDSYETAQSVSSQYGVQLNIKKVMGDVGKASAYNLAQFKGSTSALTEAVSKAQALGTSLEGVNKIAGSLLNFEDSISAELEAELLTGKDINLERARYYALTNDISGLMGEINNQMGDFDDFQNMNVIQQQAFAQALGMGVGELSEMLLLEQYRGKTYEQIAAAEGDEVAKRIENLTLQEQFNESINKMKDLFMDIAEGPLGMVAGLIGSILSNTTALIPLLSMAVGYLTLMAGKAAVAAYQSITKAIADIFSSQSKAGPIIGIAAAAAGVATMVGLIASRSKPPGAQFGGEVEEGGMVRVGEVGPEIVQLPEGAKIKPLNVAERGDLRSPNQGSSTSIDLTPLISELKSLKEVMAQQQKAIAQMKVVINPNRLEVGQMINSAQLQ